MLNKPIKTVGSICSGIEAASIAWESLDWEFKWFSEISEFPSSILSRNYPNIKNLGDMTNIANLIREKKVARPDLICGGTPCQAFSLAGFKNGLDDCRGNLTLTFVDIVNANDEVRQEEGLDDCVIFWENVEGVLTDKTNAFGSLISSLAGLDEIVEQKKWPKAGVLEGPRRNIAWRVLDAKYFGLPQQRKRLYLLAGGKNFDPHSVLFEDYDRDSTVLDKIVFPERKLKFSKDGVDYEVFRGYADCLYSAYGTKWNGNAAAYNGSLFIVQNANIRRLTPLECERLMGLPDNHTLADKASKTGRYQAVGNSWAVPVVRWIGERIVSSYSNEKHNHIKKIDESSHPKESITREGFFYNLGKGVIKLEDNNFLNCTEVPNNYHFGDMYNIVSSEAPKNLYLSPTACAGIVRRKTERGLGMNLRLEQVLTETASRLSPEEIEKRSRVQKRGEFSEKQAQLL